MNQFNAIEVLSKRFDVPQHVFAGLPKADAQGWAEQVSAATDAKPFVLANWQINFLIGRDHGDPVGPSVTVHPHYIGALTPLERSAIVAHQIRYQFGKSKRLIARHHDGVHMRGAVKCLMCRRERMSA